MLENKQAPGQLYSWSRCSDAPIHHNMGPGDMACLVGGKEQRCIGDIEAGAHPTGRDDGIPCFPVFVRSFVSFVFVIRPAVYDALDKRCVDISGQHAISAYAAQRVLPVSYTHLTLPTKA